MPFSPHLGIYLLCQVVCYRPSSYLASDSLHWDASHPLSTHMDTFFPCMGFGTPSQTVLFISLRLWLLCQASLPDPNTVSSMLMSFSFHSDSARCPPLWMPSSTHLGFCPPLYAIMAVPCLPATPCADDCLVLLYLLSELGLNRSGREGGRGRRKKWYLISFVLRRNWSMTLYLKVIQDIIFARHYLSLRILNMLFPGVLALRLAIDAKLIFFSLKVTLCFCLNPERFSFFFLYITIVLLEYASVLTGLCCKYEGSSLLLIQGRFFDYHLKNSLIFFLCLCWLFFFACLLCLSFFSWCILFLSSFLFYFLHFFLTSTKLFSYCTFCGF